MWATAWGWHPLNPSISLLTITLDLSKSLKGSTPMDLIDLLIIMYIVAGITGWIYVLTTRK